MSETATGQTNGPASSAGSRLVVEGELELLTPAHTGTGDTAEAMDAPILRDPRDGAPILPGTTIAGVLRAYLRERERGYGVPEPDPPPGQPARRRAAGGPNRGGPAGSATVRLFGGTRGDPDGGMSRLLVDDARVVAGWAASATRTELRDGVRLEPETRTAQKGFKYDLEVIPAGTRFALRFELHLTGHPRADAQLRADLAAALAGFAPCPTLLPGQNGSHPETGENGDRPEAGAIAVGARTSRGFGAGAVTAWRAREYALADPAGLVAWLAHDRPDLEDTGSAAYTREHCRTGSAAEALGLRPAGTAPAAATPAAALTAGQTAPAAEPAGGQAAPGTAPDARRAFRIQARFDLEGDLLIRSGRGTGREGQPAEVFDPAADAPLPRHMPDAVHLHTARLVRANGAVRRELGAVVAGTATAGALRARAELILHALGTAEVKQRALLAAVFGREPDAAGAPRASRLRVAERPVDGSHLLVQSHVSIDRFTGGALDGALYSVAPVFGGRVRLDFELRRPAVPPLRLGPAEARDTAEAERQARARAEAERRAELEHRAAAGLLLHLLKDLWTADLPLGGTSSVGRGRLLGREAGLTDGTTTWRIQPADAGLTITPAPDGLEALATALRDYLAEPAQVTGGTA